MEPLPSTKKGWQQDCLILINNAKRRAYFITPLFWSSCFFLEWEPNKNKIKVNENLNSKQKKREIDRKGKKEKEKKMNRKDRLRRAKRRGGEKGRKKKGKKKNNEIGDDRNKKSFEWRIVTGEYSFKIGFNFWRLA